MKPTDTSAPRTERRICDSVDLAEGGKGVRFALRSFADAEKGFAVRYRGEVRAFVNTCPHLGTDLDWQPGEFFEMAGLYLVCSTHGALFEPDNGFCVAGPCRGASLQALQTRERDGQVLLQNDNPPTPPDHDPAP
jgi:nitrite reductase/ring-hydroxylating ferredoxin subunit